MDIEIVNKIISKLRDDLSNDSERHYRVEEKALFDGLEVAARVNNITAKVYEIAAEQVAGLMIDITREINSSNKKIKRNG